MKTTLAAVLIVCNEQDNLRDCLASVHDLVDEIVILDSGSTDGTEKIAAEFNAKFFTNKNWEGFGKQRQLAQSYVNSDWVLWLDADERATPELKVSIGAVISNPTLNVVYAIPRLSWIFGKFIKHCGWYPGYVLRLYPTKLTTYNDALVHEKVKTDKSMLIAKLDGDLLHYTYRDLEQYLIKSARYARAWADMKESVGKKTSITQAVAHASAKFIRMYFLKKGFLDGKQGFLLSILSAHSTFVKYIDLWVRNNNENK